VPVKVKLVLRICCFDDFSDGLQRLEKQCNKPSSTITAKIIKNRNAD
jgi:hypothetical protein